MNKLKNWTLLLYFALSLIYLELVFRFATVGGYIFAGDFFIAAFFASMLAVVFFLLCTAFSPRVNRVLAVAVLVLMSTLFASQLVYYQIFTTFYTVYSAANASQVFQFWREALRQASCRPVILLLLFLAGDCGHCPPPA